MTIEDLVAHIQAEERIEIMGVDPNDRLLIVREKRSGIKTGILIDQRYLTGMDWDIVRPILLAEREPNPIYHVSRVVGYYSRVENWNESKMAELAARQKGQRGRAYSIDGGTGGEA